MLYFYFQSQSTECMCSSRKIQSIIEQGNIETFILGAKIIAPQLQEMLNKYSKYNLRHREAVEILINENVDIDTEKVIERDRKFSLDLRAGRFYQCIADAREHRVYGHNGEDLVLNYLCPFLLECGYDVQRRCLLDILDKASDKKSKSSDHAYIKSYPDTPNSAEIAYIKNYPDTPNSAEIAYIKNYLDTPRSLLAYCRNSLWKNFRGRYLYKFVEVSGCPEKIKDIILLKYLLLSIREIK